jgi:altronate dehydratase
VVALQCGGSDAWSGITANPALGRAVDLLVAQGGTALLAETPEVYGAEHLLTRRAASEQVGRKLLERIAWWERYTAMNGAEIDNNPTPGNKLGGLTSIFEKSLGAVAKSGTTPMVDVLQYAEPVSGHGFMHMDSPGYDPSQSPARWPADARWWSSPPDEAQCSAVNRRQPSRWQPTPRCTSA